jgi:hypothetical protein
MASAELAVALPSLIAVLVVALSAVAAATDQVRCVDAARASARLLARGDGTAVALSQGRRLAPAGARLTVTASATEVEVEVVGNPAPMLSWLGARAAPHAHAVAAREGVGPGS